MVSIDSGEQKLRTTILKFERFFTENPEEMRFPLKELSFENWMLKNTEMCLSASSKIFYINNF